MPDVERSESLRSDGAIEGNQKPRVSFNRDVHVKRIGPRGVSTSPNGSPKAPVRKQRHGKVSDEVLAREAAHVVHQADSVHCQAYPPPINDKFLSLPLRKKKINRSSSVVRSNSLKSNKPQSQRSSIFNIFKKPDGSAQDEKPLQTKCIGRSKSDVSDKRRLDAKTQIRNRNESDSEEYLYFTNDQKKQLSPIIETSPHVDYFNKTNPLDLIDRLQKYPTRENLTTENSKDLVETLDSAAKKLRIDKQRSISISGKENIDPAVKTNENGELSTNISVADSIKETINILGQNTSSERMENMIHSSQKPTEKPPLTKGHTVDHLVKKLSNEKTSLPPYNNLLIESGSLQHNGNQPFSYTRPSINSNIDINISRIPKQIIYAQVVCNNDSNGTNKQTVHTSFANPKTNFDEDEGFGYEEPSKINEKIFSEIADPYKSLSGYNTDIDVPITPTLRDFQNNDLFSRNYNKYIRKRFDNAALPVRGTADGMDGKESLTEPNLYITNVNDISGLSLRRDLLQSRINSRKLTDLNNLDSDEKLSDKYSLNNGNSLPITTKYITETKSQYYREGSPLGFIEKMIINTVDDSLPYTPKPDLENHWPSRSINSKRKLFLDSQLPDDKLIEFNTTFTYEDSNEPKSLDSQINDIAPMSEHKNIVREDVINVKRFIPNSNKFLKDQPYIDQRNIDHYRSNPEIIPREDKVSNSLQGITKTESYHTSLKRQNKQEKFMNGYNYGNSKTNPSRNMENDQRNFDIDSERKERMVDSGIENDYRKDSNSEIDFKNFSNRRYGQQENPLDKEIDDDVNISRTPYIENNLFKIRNSSDYKYHNSDSELHRCAIDDVYNNFGNRAQKYSAKIDYVNRERSIDDGSLYDPRIDKISKVETLRKYKIETKTPKEDKKISNLHKMKQLFSSSKKQKKEKDEIMVKEEDLRARYKEYKGSSEVFEDLIENSMEKRRDNLKFLRESRINEISNYENRRRLSTPSASPSPPRCEAVSKTHKGGWFKSLDRLTRRGKTREKGKDMLDSSMPPKYPQSTSGSSRNVSRLAIIPNNSPLLDIKRTQTTQKNFRYFGDTDLESNASISKHKTNIKTRALLDRSKKEKHFSSTQMLPNVEKDKKRVSSMNAINKDYNTDGRHNLLLNSYNQEKFLNQSESKNCVEEPMAKKDSNFRYGSKENIKSNQNDSCDLRLVRKPPISPLKENTRDTLSKMRKSKSDLSDRDYHRKRADIPGGTSSIESSTEGDSSQQSQHSIVYLHAATVGDIPGLRKRNKHSASREELSSTGSPTLQPQVKTISRSISVLAPWKPRHIREGYDINYSQMQNNLTNGRSKAKPHNSSQSSQDSSQKIKRRNGGIYDSGTINRRVKYDNNEIHLPNNALRRKHRDRNIQENYSDSKQYMDSKTITLDRSKFGKNGINTGSAEALSARSKMRDGKIARSISMPRDSNKSAGWFKTTRKSKNLVNRDNSTNLGYI